MSNESEGGGFGAGVYKSYTYMLMLGAQAGLLWFTHRDLGANGSRLLSKAFGIQANFWIWVAVIGGSLFVTVMPSKITTDAYEEYTGHHWLENRTAYAQSGGSDIAFWSGFFVFIGTVYLFAQALPPGLLGVLRPFALLLGATIIGRLVARIIVRLVFNAIYGPPRTSNF